MLPEGWQQTKFGQVFGSSRTKGNAGLPTLSVTMTGGLVPRDSIDRKMDSSLSAEEHLLVRKGDIAYNMMRMWQGASGLSSHDALVSPAYVVLRAKDDIDPLFAAYLFKLAHTVHQFWAYSYGITDDRLRLYFKDFGAIPVNLPPLIEQRKIAEILATWDIAISVQERLVANAKLQKKALMQILLPTGAHPPKERLPGFSGDWREIKLRDLGRCYNGVTYAPEDVVEGKNGLLILRSSNVQNGRLDFADTVFVKPSVKTSCLTEEGDILICVRNGSRNLIGKTARISSDARGHAHGAFMSLFRSSEPDFAYHLFKSHAYEQQVKRNLGATINSINTSDLHDFRFMVPPKTERARIAEILSANDREIEQHEKLLSGLCAQKSALMQQLLTGKRRVLVEDGGAA